MEAERVRMQTITSLRKENSRLKVIVKYLLQENSRVKKMILQIAEDGNGEVPGTVNAIADSDIYERVHQMLIEMLESKSHDVCRPPTSDTATQTGSYNTDSRQTKQAETRKTDSVQGKRTQTLRGKTPQTRQCPVSIKTVPGLDMSCDSFEENQGHSTKKSRAQRKIVKASRNFPRQRVCVDRKSRRSGNISGSGRYSGRDTAICTDGSLSRRTRSSAGRTCRGKSELAQVIDEVCEVGLATSSSDKGQSTTVCGVKTTHVDDEFVVVTSGTDKHSPHDENASLSRSRPLIDKHVVQTKVTGGENGVYLSSSPSSEDTVEKDSSLPSRSQVDGWNATEAVEDDRFTVLAESPSSPCGDDDVELSEEDLDKNAQITDRSKPPDGTATPTRYKPVQLQLCTSCGASYRSKSGLKDHMRQKHAFGQGARYTCHVCSKQFMKVTEFQSHLNSHAGVKPFGCEKCKKTFINRRNLTRHKCRPKDPLAEAPVYVCSACGKCFISIKMLRQHMHVHDDVPQYSCPKCLRKFRQRQSLSRHMTKRCSVMKDTVILDQNSSEQSEPI